MTSISIVGISNYLGVDVFRIGQLLTLMKDTDNCHDTEAISVLSEAGVKYGYVANSIHTVAQGTHSAGYIYRDFADRCLCRVQFIVHDTVIAELLPDVPEKEIVNLGQNSENVS